MILGIMQGCQTTTRIRASTNKASQPSIVSAKYISITAKANYRVKSNDYKCDIKIRIERDNLIWFSITYGWGIELVRGRFTPAGIELINHVDKSYQVYDYASLQAHWHIPCSHNLIQATLLGELHGLEKESTISHLGNQIILQQHQKFWECLATLYEHTKQLASLSVLDSSLQHKWHVSYEYKKGCQQDLLFCNLKAYFKDFKLFLQYKDISFSRHPLSFPFNIPRQYDKW
ncbi:MAG: DUF4292 domain-containing protein [Candidatus Amoebophilus sp.]